MSLNQNFTIKNNLNTLGSILSGGVDLATIFSPSNTTVTVAANNGSTFSVAGGQTETFSGTNGINTSTATGTRTVTISGIPATTSSVGVASFGSGNFAVDSNGGVTIKSGGVGSTELGGAINNVSIGNTTRSSGKFTTLDANNTVTLSPANANVTLSPTGTGTVAIGPATAGTIDNVAIGNTTRSSVKSTTLDANSTVTLSPANANVSLAPTGTGTVTINPATLGTIDNVTIGGTTKAAGYFTNINVTGNAYLSGSLYIAGSAISVTQSSLIVNEPMIYLAEGNPGNQYDIGFAGNYKETTYAHTGLLRDHNSSSNNGPATWYLFSNMVIEPSASTVGTNTKTIDTLVANVSGSLTGNASTATNLQNAQNFSLGSGDVTSPTVSFNGSGAVALVTTIANNAVTYAKFQTVAANSVVGNPTGSTANAQAIPASTTGFALLSATNAAAGATTLGLGTTNNVQFNTVTVNNGSVGTNNAVFNGSVASNNTLTVTTFNKTTYNTAKYVAQIKKSGGASAALEILVNYNTGNSTWEGTVYGILDSGSIFTNVDVSTTGSTVDLVFTLNGSSNYSITVAGQAV